MKSNIERIKLQKCCVLLPKINVKNYFEKSDSIQSNVPEKSSTNTFLKKGLQNEIENIFTFPVPQKKIPLVTEKMDIVRKYCDSSTSRNTNTKKTQTDVKKSFFHTMVDENFKEILKKEITEVIKLILSNEALSFKSVIKIDDNFISKIVEKMLNETIFKSNVSESNEKTILKCHNCFIMNEGNSKVHKNVKFNENNSFKILFDEENCNVAYFPDENVLHNELKKKYLLEIEKIKNIILRWQTWFEV